MAVLIRPFVAGFEAIGDTSMEAVKALQRLGFFIDRQRGSHAVLKKVTRQGERGCVIPMHREVALGTLPEPPLMKRGYFGLLRL